MRSLTSRIKKMIKISNKISKTNHFKCVFYILTYSIVGCYKL